MLPSKTNLRISSALIDWTGCLRGSSFANPILHGHNKSTMNVGLNELLDPTKKANPISIWVCLFRGPPKKVVLVSLSKSEHKTGAVKKTSPYLHSAAPSGKYSSSGPQMAGTISSITCRGVPSCTVLAPMRRAMIT